MDTTRIRVDGPAAMLAVVPRLIGFHPVDSLVVVGASGPRNQVEMGFRYDLPEDTEAREQIADHAAETLTLYGIRTVILIGYGAGELVTPLMDVMRDRAARVGRAVKEALRVEGGRYWSYLCTSPGCCPTEGIPFDTETHPATAAMVVAGLTTQPSREALEATLAGPTGDKLTKAQAARHDAERKLD